VAVFDVAELTPGRQLPSLSRRFTLRIFAERHELAYGPFFGEGLWPEKNIHSDDEAARREGLPGAVISAPQVFSMVNRVMLMCFGEGWIAGGSISLKMISPVLVDELLTAKAIVNEVTGTDGDGHRVNCDVRVERRNGEPVCVGTASASI
jgi:3-hydroxybutyryl-CoA dehydratase